MLAERFNREGHEIVDHHTYVIASDGDLQEGIASEASSLAGHLGLGRLIAFYDDNHISIEGDTKLSFTEDVGARYEAYGWHVQNLHEDIELDRLEEALAEARSVTDKPSLIIVRTHIAPGSPNKQDTHGAHGSPLGEEEIKLTKEVYNWPSLEPFFVPDAALEHFRECIPRGEQFESDWRERFEAYRAEHPDAAAEFERINAAHAAGGLGRRGPDQDARRRHDRHPQGLAGRHPVGGRAGARAGRRLRRPRAEHADADQRRRRRRERHLRRAQLPLRHPRARDGRDRQRARPARVPRVRLGLLDLQRLHEGVDPARRDHAHPVDLRVHARLDRRGRGRPDPSADRAARDAAGDAEPQPRAPGGLQRDRAGVAVRAEGDRHADGDGALTPGPADLGPGRHPRRRDRPRRLRALRRGGLRADPDGLGLRGPHRRRRGEAAARGGREGPGRLDAVPGPLRRPGPGLPRLDPAAGRARARVGRGGEPAGLASLGRRRRRRGGDGGLRRLRSGPVLYEHFGFTGEKVAERARAVLAALSA